MVNDTRKVKIYVLKHPDTLEIRYVGKTIRSLSRRLGNHISNAKGNKHNKHLSNWILSILALGKRPIEESRRKRSETIKAWWSKRKSIEDIVES